MDGLVFSDGVFNRAGNKLLDLLRGCTGPGARGNSYPHGNVRIFSLWHGVVAEPAPHEHADKENPRNLRVLDEKPGNVTRLFDPILVVSVCHSLISLRDDLDGFTIRQELRTDCDYLFPGLYSRDGNRTLVGCS